MKDDMKISMLLNIDNFYGESEGRLGPMIKLLLIGLGPFLLQAWFGFPLPSWLFWPLEIVWFIRVALLTVGRENQRLEQFRRQLHDDYSSAEELLRIRAIHPDGCIEYVDNKVEYLLVAANGTSYDPIARSKTLRQFLAQLGTNFDLDIYVQNITEMKSLEDRYANVKLFVEDDAAKDFVDIIDHNRNVVYSESRLTRIIIGVKGGKHFWTDIRDCCKSAVYSTAARAFKDIHIATVDEVKDIINTDVRGYVNIDAVMQRKYATHQYYGSKILYYGDESKKVDVDTVVEERGFMIDNE